MFLYSQDMVNALGAYVQSVFANPMGAMTALLNTPAPISSVNPSSGASSNQTNSAITASPTGDSSPVGFYFRGSFVPLLQLYAPLTPRPQL